MKPEDKKDKPIDPNGKTSIIIDKKQYFTEKNPITGAELKALAGIAGAFDVFKDLPGQADDIKMSDGMAVEIKNGDHFYSVPTTLNPGASHATPGIR